jgi:hypothetical protein
MQLQINPDWTLAPTKLGVIKDMLAMCDRLKAETKAGDRESAINTCLGIMRLNLLCPSLNQALVLGRLSSLYYQSRNLKEAARYAELALDPQLKFTSVNHRIQLQTIVNKYKESQC